MDCGGLQVKRLLQGLSASPKLELGLQDILRTQAGPCPDASVLVSKAMLGNK
jgi:hypothetical protein